MDSAKRTLVIENHRTMRENKRLAALNAIENVVTGEFTEPFSQNGTWSRTFFTKDNKHMIVMSAQQGFNAGFIEVRGGGCTIKTDIANLQLAFETIASWSTNVHGTKEHK